MLEMKLLSSVPARRINPDRHNKAS